MKQMELNKMFKNGGYSRFCDHEYDRNIDGIKRMDVCPKCFYFPCSCLNRLSKDRKSPTPSPGSSWFKSWCHPTLVTKKWFIIFFEKETNPKFNILKGESIWVTFDSHWTPSHFNPLILCVKNFCLIHFLIDLGP